MGDIDVAGRKNYVDDEEVSVMYEDITGHGTGVASIIASKEDNIGIKGMNPNADVYSVKVLDHENKAPVSRIIEGIYWCIENDMDIINMSFGMKQYSRALEKAIIDANENGILVVASAGNTGNEVTYPAAFDGVLAVGSVGSNGVISDFSAKGDKVDIYAPGEQIKAQNFYEGTMVTQGTSIAAAHVTGAASILMGIYPEESIEYIAGLISDSGKEIENDSAKLLDVQYAIDNKDNYQLNYNQTTRGDVKVEIPEGQINNPLETEKFDVDYVVGQWSSENESDTKMLGHQWMIEQVTRENYTTDSNYIRVLRYASAYPDDHKSEGYFMHATKSKWCAGYLMYMYELTRYVRHYQGSGDFYEAAFNAVNAEFVGISNDLIDRQRIRDYVDNLRSREVTGMEHIINTKDREITYLLLLGVTCHLVGDIYAHRTINPEGIVIFDLANIVNEQGNPVYPRSQWEDNPNYMGERFFYATRLGNQFVMLGTLNNFTYNNDWIRTQTFMQSYPYHIWDNGVVY